MADVVMLLLILGFTRAGLSSGLIRRVLGLMFLAASFVVGAYLRGPVGVLVNIALPQMPKDFAEMLGYSIASAALLVALNLVARPLMRRVPQQGWSRRTDQVLGAAFGALESVLILSAGIVILHTYGTAALLVGALTGQDTGIVRDITTAVDGSTIGKLLEQTTVPLVLVVLGPLLPKDITAIVPSNIPGGIPFFPKVPLP